MENENPFEYAIQFLPNEIKKKLEAYSKGFPKIAAEISEIRLREGSFLSLTYNRENLIFFDTKPIICSKDDLEATLYNFTEASLHTYEETIKEGYIFHKNFRIGLSGKANLKGGKIESIYDISSISIRLPHILPPLSKEIIPLLSNGEKRRSALIYSPPAEGKTSLLRDIAKTLSSKSYLYNIAVIDTRYEIYEKSAFQNSLCDFLFGYPKALGMEIAMRNLSPQYIICDEIGHVGECEAILSMQNAGIPLIASAHGEGFEKILRRKGIKMLYDEGVFDYFIGIKRDAESKKFIFDIHEAK